MQAGIAAERELGAARGELRRPAQEEERVAEALLHAQRDAAPREVRGQRLRIRIRQRVREALREQPPAIVRKPGAELAAHEEREGEVLVRRREARLACDRLAISGDGLVGAARGFEREAEV